MQRRVYMEINMNSSLYELTGTCMSSQGRVWAHRDLCMNSRGLVYELTGTCVWAHRDLCMSSQGRVWAHRDLCMSSQGLVYCPQPSLLCTPCKACGISWWTDKEYLMCHQIHACNSLMCFQAFSTPGRFTLLKVPLVNWKQMKTKRRGYTIYPSSFTSFVTAWLRGFYIKVHLSTLSSSVTH